MVVSYEPDIIAVVLAPLQMRCGMKSTIVDVRSSVQFSACAMLDIDEGLITRA